MKRSDDLMSLISKLKLDNAKSNELLKKSDEEIEGSNKKITSLSKEISALNVALNDSQELMKSLQKMHEEKVKKMESEKSQIQELLEKELADRDAKLTIPPFLINKTKLTRDESRKTKIIANSSHTQQI